MVTKTHLRSISKLVKDFLLSNGGMSNGYETYAEGAVQVRMTRGMEVFTPKVRSHMYQDYIQLGKDLEDEIKNYLVEQGIEEEIVITKRHIEHGCYETHVTYLMSEKVKLW